MNRPFALLLSALLLTAAVGRTHAQWPQFRGTNGSGVDSSTGYPVEFSPSKNVAWKVPVPFAQSSPVVVGNRVYLTGSDQDLLLTICLDARTGQTLWRKEIRRERTTETYKANDPASPTPAADEHGVVAFFPDHGLVAYTPDGDVRWTARLGPFKNFYGMAGSPIIVDDLVVLVCDQLTNSFAIALNRQSGTLTWKTDRPGMTTGWATPTVFRPSANRVDLIVLGSTRLDAYDVASGTQRWWLPIGSGGALGAPLVHGDTVLVSTLGSNEPAMPTFPSVLAQYDKNKDGRLSLEEFRGDPELGEHFGWIDRNDDDVVGTDEWNTARMLGSGEWGAIAIRPGDARGQLQSSAVRWRFQRNLPYIPAPLLYNDVFYMVRTGGIITSVDPATGTMLRQGRSPEALGEYYASPVAADGKVFLASTEGKVTVIEAGADWHVLGVNDLGAEIHATPALSDGRIFVRTRDTLYCFSGS